MESTRSTTRSPEREHATARRRGMLVAPLCLVAIVLGARLVLGVDAAVFGWTLLVLFAAAFGWMIVSVFFPASADRSCPECGEAGLERMDPAGLRGVRCSRCGWEDRDASAFLIAESEGEIESSILRERARRRESVAARKSSPASERLPAEDPRPVEPETAR
jgi:hypothetical protein